MESPAESHAVTFTPAFYRAAAICSFVSAVTTLMLIFLPDLYGPAPTLEARFARTENPWYLLRAWAYLVHPFFVVGAALGVAMALRHTRAGLAVAGFLGFLLWGFTEASQQTLTLVAFHRWAEAFPNADETARAMLQAQVSTYDALWDAMYLLLIIAFLIGNLFYGIAMWRGRGLTKALSLFFFAAATLTLMIISGELGGPVLPAPIGRWLYPLIQPAARVAIGVWLWRNATIDATANVKCSGTV